MCRFTLYLGPSIRLSTLLIDPAHSLIRQSSNAAEREEPLNGDGFGVGWFQPELSFEPAVFRSITPAWNNRNLRNLSRVVASGSIMAHVRAATQSSGVNEANCHPFRWKNYLCMHNGDIGNFSKVRRRLLETVCDEAFANVYGSTDSEHFFALIIDELLKNNGSDPMLGTAQALNTAIWRALKLVEQFGDKEPSYLNVAISDGEHAAVSRFCSVADERPESLYYFSGKPFYQPAARATSDHTLDSVVVASERLTDDGAWHEIPPNHIVVVNRGRAPLLFHCDPAGLKPV